MHDANGERRAPDGETCSPFGLKARPDGAPMSRRGDPCRSSGSLAHSGLASPGSRQPACAGRQHRTATSSPWQTRSCFGPRLRLLSEGRKGHPGRTTGNAAPRGSVPPAGFDDRCETGRQGCPRERKRCVARATWPPSDRSKCGSRPLTPGCIATREPQPEPKTAQVEGCAGTNTDRKQRESATMPATLEDRMVRCRMFISAAFAG